LIPSDDDLFLIEDFESIQVRVAVENQTSKTSVDFDARVYGDVAVQFASGHEPIRLMELRDAGISLDAPARTATAGHILDCTIDVSGTPIPLCFKVRGRVSAEIPLEENRVKLDVELIDFEARFFDALRSLFSKRQAEIEDFLQRMKR